MITRFYTTTDYRIVENKLMAITKGPVVKAEVYGRFGNIEIPISDKEEILEQLKENFEVIQEGAKVLNMDLKELLIQLSF